MIIEYEVGQIPSKPLSIQVKDSKDNALNLTTWGTYAVEMLGSDNEVIDLSDVTLQTENVRSGILTVIWPKTHSLFTQRGEYVLRVVLRDAEGSIDYTRTLTIMVRAFGRLN